jgi:hypothetical protein
MARRSRLYVFGVVASLVAAEVPHAAWSAIVDQPTVSALAPAPVRQTPTPAPVPVDAGTTGPSTTDAAVVVAPMLMPVSDLLPAGSEIALVPGVEPQLVGVEGLAIGVTATESPMSTASLQEPNDAAAPTSERVAPGRPSLVPAPELPAAAQVVEIGSAEALVVPSAGTLAEFTVATSDSKDSSSTATSSTVAPASITLDIDLRSRAVIGLGASASARGPHRLCRRQHL